jgi:hypothetical protein
MNKKTASVVVGIIITISVIALVFYNSAIFDRLNGQSNTLVSATQQWVEPQGSDNNGQWRGSFWNLVAAVSATDTFTGVKFPAGSTSTVTISSIQTALKTGSTIEIDITRGQPFLERYIVQKTKQVCKGASQSIQGTSGDPSEGSTKVSDLNVNFWDWAEPSWRIYAPYTVTVLKDGVSVGSVVLNDYSSDMSATIQTNQGPIRIEHLGNLQGNYLSPNFPVSMAMIDGSNVFDYNSIANAINMQLTPSTSPPGYSGGSGYSQYWYGSTFFSDQTHSARFIQNPMTRSISFDQYGGWKPSNGGSTALPIRPVLYSTDKSSQNDANAQSKQCLTEYLNSLPTTNYASSLNSYQKVEFITGPTNSNGQQTGQLKLVIPLQQAYQTAMVNIRFPTELADTIVDRPSIGNMKLSAHWESTGTDHAQAVSTQKLDVDVTQHGTVASTGNVKVTCSNAKVGIFPLSGSVDVAPNQKQTVVFAVTNLGVLNQETDIPIIITVSDAYTAQQTDSITVYLTLLPTLTTGQTQLIVHAAEKTNSSTSGKPIAGLLLQVLYPAEQPLENRQGYTGTDGTQTFNLDVAGSGAFTGKVMINSIETNTYKASQTTVSVAPGINEITLLVERKDSVYPGLDWLTIAIIIAVVVVVLVIIAVSLSKRKKHRHR